MSKVHAPCRPAAALTFTIDNILNLKTSTRSCDSLPAPCDELAAATRKDALQTDTGGQRHQPAISGKTHFGPFLVLFSLSW